MYLTKFYDKLYCKISINQCLIHHKFCMLDGKINKHRLLIHLHLLSNKILEHIHNHQKRHLKQCQNYNLLNCILNEHCMLIQCIFIIILNAQSLFRNNNYYNLYNQQKIFQNYIINSNIIQLMIRNKDSLLMQPIY